MTRLKSVPALRDSQELPEAERTRGAALADRLSVPVLARAWQMLLKGVGEVETAPDRRAAAEMVLIRLCHVADLPPPGDLVRRLTQRAGCRRPARLRRRRPVAACARSPVARPVAVAATRCAAAGQLPRRGRAGRRAARGDAARASDALGAPGALRAAGDRAAARAGGAAGPRRAAWRAAAARRPARAGPSRCPPPRASRRGRAGQRRRCRAAQRGGRSSAGARDPGRVSRARASTRCTTPPPTPMALPTADVPDADAEPSDEMELDE